MREMWKRGARILFVEPPITPLNIESLARFLARVGRVRKSAHGFYIYKPVATLYMIRQFRLNLTVPRQLLSTKEMSRTIARLGFGQVHPLVIWMSDPFLFTPHLDKIFNQSDVLIYDRIDEWTAFEQLKPFRDKIADRENKIILKADLVFATSNRLLHTLPQAARHKYLVRNAADYAHFAKARGSNPQDLTSIPRPIALYAGMISEWLDWKLILASAKQLRKISFVFVGPTNTAINPELTSLPNVHFLGAKPYGQLPNYLWAADIFLLPFKTSPLTKSVNPVKLYEYLSVGKPVVSTSIPEISRLKDQRLILTARTLDSFIRRLSEAVSNMETNDVAQARIEFSRRNSWDARGDEIIRIVDRHIRISRRS